ncbi:MAG: DUF748 domain-containing protein [Candidatus Omnitrophica bacterium]|nr:DUF748 domain-containing protein [Candidatus Omnitrophota bacterium]
MRKLEKIIALTILTLAVIFGTLYIFINLTGRAIIIKQIEDLTDRKATIGYFDLSPTLELEIRKLDIEGLAKIDALYISPDLFAFFTGKAIISSLKLVRPEFTFTKTPPIVVNEQETSKDTILPAAEVPASDGEAKEFKTLPFGFKRIKIENGKLNYIDQSISPDSIKIALEEISFNVTNLYFFPSQAATSFELKGRIPWREGQVYGQLELKGWINYLEKDMQAALKIRDIDAIYLYPYYSMWVDLEKARIEKARLNFSADINGLNNNVNVECRLELTDLVRKPLEPGQNEEKESRITNKIIDIFKEVDQGKVELNFSLKTKMDSPHFGLNTFQTAFEEKINKGRFAKGFKAENTLVLPLKVMEGGVRGLTDLTRAMIDGIFAIGGEISQSTEGAFKK